MSYAEVLGRTWEGNHLFTALLELTYRCNLDCFFCYNDLGLQGRPLSLQQYLALLDELSDLGTLHLALTGGEPLAHPEFFAIGSAARGKGFVIRVKSNGHALYGPLLRRLKDEVDPFTIDVSLHGACAATHDRQTRVPGSFERLLRNLDEIRAAGIGVKLNCTLTAWNEDEIEAMYALADARGLQLDMNPQVSPRDDGDGEPLSISASDAGIRHLMAVQGRRARSVLVDMPTPTRRPARAGDKQCGAGSSGVAIDPYGNVYPCVQWRRPLGNLHETGMRAIWEGSQELATVRGLTVAAKRLTESLGPAARGIGFCAGLAELTGGSAAELYPEARRRLRLIEESGRG